MGGQQAPGACFTTMLLLTAVALSAGTSPGTTAAPQLGCSDLLDSVIQRQRIHDTSGAIDAELDALGDRCAEEYDVFVDYATLKQMAKSFGRDTCADAARHMNAAAVALAREDHFCKVAKRHPRPKQQWGGANSDGYDTSGLFDATENHQTAPTWICSYSPTMDYDWHNDVICSNGIESQRPYLRAGDSFITRDEIMSSAEEYQDGLNRR